MSGLTQSGFHEHRLFKRRSIRYRIGPLRVNKRMFWWWQRRRYGWKP